jgi:hypothetical protein
MVKYLDRHFSKEDTQMFSKHRKDAQHSDSLGKLSQNHNLIQLHNPHIRMVTIKNQKIASVAGDLKISEILCSVAENKKWHSLYGKLVWWFLKKKKNKNKK